MLMYHYLNGMFGNSELELNHFKRLEMLGIGMDSIPCQFQSSYIFPFSNPHHIIVISIPSLFDYANFFVIF